MMLFRKASCLFLAFSVMVVSSLQAGNRDAKGEMSVLVLCFSCKCCDTWK